LTAADAVYGAIKDMIVRKELTSGQRLSELGLSERLGVSRTPVHEALRRLSNEGFVLIVPKSGAWVASPSWREVENAYAVRCKLETWAAKIAAHHVTPLFLARLNEQILIEDEIFKTRDLERYLEVNIAFHKIIAEASGNSLLEEYIGDVLSKTFIYMVFMERFFDFENNPSLDEHRSILEAYSSGDENMCVCLTEKHIMNTLDGLRR
jgi:DNA-binding GntR family transcriptional regulator